MEQFRPPGSLTQTGFMDQQSNDASIMAVPEHHHMREQKLKQKKMNELKQRAN